jgi:hypothetical protein
VTEVCLSVLATIVSPGEHGRDAEMSRAQPSEVLASEEDLRDALRITERTGEFRAVANNGRDGRVGSLCLCRQEQEAGGICMLGPSTCSSEGEFGPPSLDTPANHLIPDRHRPGPIQHEFQEFVRPVRSREVVTDYSR